MNTLDLEVWCISNRGARPGVFTPGKKYTVEVDDVLQVFIVGDNGTEYDWSVVKDLFITKGEWRARQLERLYQNDRT